MAHAGPVEHGFLHSPVSARNVDPPSIGRMSRIQKSGYDVQFSWASAPRLPQGAAPLALCTEFCATPACSGTFPRCVGCFAATDNPKRQVRVCRRGTTEQGPRTE